MPIIWGRFTDVSNEKWRQLLIAQSWKKPKLIYTTRVNSKSVKYVSLFISWLIYFTSQFLLQWRLCYDVFLSVATSSRIRSPERRTHIIEKIYTYNTLFCTIDKNEVGRCLRNKALLKCAKNNINQRRRFKVVIK